MSDIERKFLFVTGKGGVGKTTVSVALASALAQAGKRVLLAVTEPGQVAELLGVAEIGTEMVEVRRGLTATRIEAEMALREYGSMMLRSKTAYRALFENRVARSFLAAVPGLYQWATLGKAWYHTQETLPDGRPRFDCVVLDAPATGHGLEMLRVPKVITEAATPGPLRRDAERAWELLRNPAECGILLVTLPEESPVQETFELSKDLANLGLSPTRIVLNGLVPPLFSPGDEARLTGLDVSLLTTMTQGVVDVARERLVVERLQRAQTQRLRSGTPLPVTELPWTAEATSPVGVAELSAAFSPLLVPAG